VVPRQVLEQIRHVLPERGVAREHAKVGVNARRPRVVVPRPDVAVSAETRFFLAHDHGALAVGLEAHQPVGHVAPGVLELLGEAHVAGLVEAGLELHQDGDLGERKQSQEKQGLYGSQLRSICYICWALTYVAGLVEAGLELHQDGDLGAATNMSAKQGLYDYFRTRVPWIP
jgi:hypothetical protein